MLVCGAPGIQTSLEVASDGTGGAFVVWEDWRAGDYEKDIYASHILAEGTLAPGWPVNGLAICAAPYDQFIPHIVPDGVGGFFATWNDGRAVAWDLYIVRIQGDGTLAPGWQPDGTLVWASPGSVGEPKLVPDAAGGVFISWGEGAADGHTDVFVQRVDASGAPHSGWPARGVPVCTALADQYAIRMIPDGLGGVVLSWNDLRAYAYPGNPNAADVYALRVLPDGSRAPGWPENGRVVSGGPGFQFNSSLAPDGLGGAYIAFERLKSIYYVSVQHLTGGGEVAPGWPDNGLAVAPGLTTGQNRPWMAPDGHGGAIVAWEDHRRIGGYDDIYAQKFVTDGPTPVLLALVSFEAEPDRVVLTWHRASGGAGEATIYRRSESDSWLALGHAAFDGSGLLRFEDRAVVAGTRYAYRLGVVESGAESFSAETWVDVPAALALALDGLRPNPAVRDLNVSFVLPTRAPARLELLDVSGRTVLARESGSLGPGRHVVRLGSASEVAPGVYWLRLTHADRTLVTRAVVMR